MRINHLLGYNWTSWQQLCQLVDILLGGSGFLLSNAFDWLLEVCFLQEAKVLWNLLCLLSLCGLFGWCRLSIFFRTSSGCLLYAVECVAVTCHLFGVWSLVFRWIFFTLFLEFREQCVISILFCLVGFLSSILVVLLF